MTERELTCRQITSASSFAASLLMASGSFLSVALRLATFQVRIRRQGPSLYAGGLRDSEYTGRAAVR